jgi:hypothetical protein
MFDILDPTTTAEEDPINYAPRPESLNGLKIGLVENTKPNAEKVLQAIANQMAETYGTDMIHLVHKSQRAPLADADIKKLQIEADFVICGVGDCGACSSGSVLDAILLERSGIPAVAIITDRFEETGQEMAGLWGVPTFRFVQMPHPLGSLAVDEIEDRAASLLEKISILLLRGQEASEKAA